MPNAAANVLQLDLHHGIRIEPDAEIIKRIERLIANPPEGSVPFIMTPGVSQYVLDRYNQGNRTKKPVKIREYADSMKADKWAETRESLKFSDKGLLRDGQNRLAACVLAGTPFKTHIDFGMPDGAFLQMDQGKSRSGGDVLQAAGYKNTGHLPGAVRWVHLFRTGRARNRDSFSPNQTLELLQEKYPDLPDYMPSATAIYRTTAHPAGLVAALLYEFHRLNPEKAKVWTENWKAGQIAGDFKPLGLVTKRVSKIKTDTQGTIRDIVRVALLIQAWNLFVQGKKGVEADIAWTVEQEFPQILAGTPEA